MARQPADIDPSSCFRVSPVPELGLKDTLEFPLRAYVLRCKGGKFYTGIHPAKDIQKRITEQFTAKRKHGASEFCETNPPLSVICVWPAIDHAVEAALFFALMGSLNCSDFRKLGGWVYTSAKPSPFQTNALIVARPIMLVIQFVVARIRIAFTNVCIARASTMLVPGVKADCMTRLRRRR